MSKYNLTEQLELLDELMRKYARKLTDSQIEALKKKIEIEFSDAKEKLVELADSRSQSAYERAMATLKTLKGDKGDKGNDGPPGRDGKQGEKGNDGPPGEKGNKGDSSDVDLNNVLNIIKIARGIENLTGDDKLSTKAIKGLVGGGVGGGSPVIIDPRTDFANISGIPSYVTGRYYYSPLFASGGTTLAIATGTVYYVPFLVVSRRRFTGMMVRVTVAVNNAIVNMAIYKSDGSAGAPTGTPISGSDTGSSLVMSGTSAQTQEFTFATPIDLEAGLYWIAYQHNAGTNVTTNAHTATCIPIWGISDTNKTSALGVQGYTETKAYATLGAVGTLVERLSTVPATLLKA